MYSKPLLYQNYVRLSSHVHWCVCMYMYQWSKRRYCQLQQSRGLVSLSHPPPYTSPWHWSLYLYSPPIRQGGITVIALLHVVLNTAEPQNSVSRMRYVGRQRQRKHVKKIYLSNWIRDLKVCPLLRYSFYHVPHSVSFVGGSTVQVCVSGWLATK